MQIISKFLYILVIFFLGMLATARTVSAQTFVNLCTDPGILPEPCCDGSNSDSGYYLMPPNTVEQNAGFCALEPGARFDQKLKTSSPN